MTFLKSRMFQLSMLLMVVALGLHVLSDWTFLTPRNLTNIARQVSINGILAIGMTYVILLGGIDLSVGSVVALAGVVAGLVQTSGWFSEGLSAVIAVFSALFVGGFLGALTGTVVTRFRIAPFIITLGVMVIARGLALIFSNGAAIAPLTETYTTIGSAYIPGMWAMALLSVPLIWRMYLVRSSVMRVSALFVSIAFLAWVLLGYRGLPVPALILMCVASVGVWVLNRTRWGRFVLATGGNERAAVLAGVPVRSVHFWVYVVMGLLSGVGAVILSSRLNGALPTAGQLFELDAIAAVVIGGTSLQGGKGTIAGSIVGALFIGVMNNGMSLLAVPEFYQMVIKGVLIVCAVLWDQASASKRLVAST